jgi:transcriptional regulator with PAS, ATPase and Fis domain
MITEELDLLMTETLESIYAALVVNAAGKVAYINKKYADILGVDPITAIGQPVEKIVPRTRMPIVIKTGQEEIGSIFELKNGDTIVCNRIPIRNKEKVIGAVAFTTFTRMDELSTFMKQIQRLHLEIDLYKKELGKLRGAKYSFEQIIGKTPAISKLKDLAQKVSQTKSTILITGETGTGKEFFAHAIHQHSPRTHHPFIRLNCAAIPTELLESELFGYEEGAFTGAKKGGKPGKFEQAHSGTLLLDEVNQLPMNLQSKLLRVIQEKELERVGGLRTIEIDVRLICTTNQDLLGLVQKGAFREDLFYRINVVELMIPPLRERLGDIPDLVQFCIARINRDLGLNIEGIETDVLERFQQYQWPGNVRELDHALERAANMALSGYLMREHFDFLELRMLNKQLPEIGEIDFSLESIRGRAEKEGIRQALAKAGGNKSVAADILRIDRSVLYDKTKKYGI